MVALHGAGEGGLSPSVYYNEIDSYCAQWLRNLMDADLIPRGDIDTRSIEDVVPNELRGYTQCHFFAGLGGWPLALALAGWPSSWSIWTGSCPCQPFSVAGAGAGTADKRHLWPAWFHLIAQCRPSVIFGEQVAAAVKHGWLDGVCADLEGQAYAVGSSVLPACSVNAPHKRERLWFVADTHLSGFGAGGWQGQHSEREARTYVTQPFASALADDSGTGLAQRECERGVLRQVGAEPQGQDASYDARLVGHTYEFGAREGWQQRSGQLRGTGSDSQTSSMGDADSRRPCAGPLSSPAGHGHTVATNDRYGAWDTAEWIFGHDGKARRVEPSIRLLAHGIPARVGKLRALGNAFVPQVAAEFIEAYIEARGLIFEHQAVAA